MPTVQTSTDCGERAAQPLDARGPGWRRAFAALGNPAYRWWFVAQIFSASGVFTQAVAQSWLLLELTGSALDLGLLAVFSWTPVLLGGAWAGAWVDRLDRRRLLITTQTTLIVFGVTLAVLAATGVVRPWMLFALAAATGCVAALDNPARQVFVLELVGRGRVASAVSLYEVILNASRVFGPALGGVLLGLSGPPLCFLVNALSYLPALAVLLRFRPVPTPRAAEPGPRAADRREPGAVRAGLSYVWRSPAIRACVLLAAAGGTLFNLAVGLPLLATRVFGLGGGGYGAMMAAFGVGALPGAFLAAAGTDWPTGRQIRLLAVGTGVAVLATAYAPHVIVAFVGLAVAGLLSIWLISLANTLVQLRAEPAMRGRVMGVWTMALPGMMPLTSLLTGAVAQAFGGRAGFALAGVALLVTGGLAWRSLRD